MERQERAEERHREALRELGARRHEEDQQQRRSACISTRGVPYISSVVNILIVVLTMCNLTLSSIVHANIT